MKKFFILIITATAGYFLSCTEKKTAEQPIQNVDTTNAVTSFFPVTSFLKGQIRQFDSITTTPLHIITIHEKADSESIKREQLKLSLQTFLTPEITETNLLKYFKESKFNDQTLGTITFTYDPITTLPDSINILTWNVYVSPATGNVTKVYMVKHLIENGQNIIQQLTWQTDKYAEITEILDKPDSSAELLKQEKFIWNFNQ
jgi:hypothetical protein